MAGLGQNPLFCREERGISPECLTLAHVDDDLVLAFMAWIETERKCSITTRNQRLAAIHAFFRYVQAQTPERLLMYQRILSIPLKKTGKPAVSYLTTEALEAILNQPDRKTPAGRRDLLLLTVLYDSGARVQELTDLLVRDIRLTQPATITLRGKGRKVRHVPLMSRTAVLLKDYLEERRLTAAHRSDHPLFFNSRRQKLTRAGVSYIIDKYVNVVKEQNTILLPDKVSPHVFRHTKAMHLLQANVNLVYIRDFLGHASGGACVNICCPALLNTLFHLCCQQRRSIGCKVFGKCCVCFMHSLIVLALPVLLQLVF